MPFGLGAFAKGKTGHSSSARIDLDFL